MESATVTVETTMAAPCEVQQPAFQVDASDLARTVKLLAKVASKGKRAIPILGAAHIVADGDCVSLTATNQEQALTVLLQATAIAPGEVCLPVRELQATLKGVKRGATLQLEPGAGHAARLTLGGASRTLHGFDVREFPAVPGLAPESVTVPGYTLRAAFGAVLTAQSTDETRLTLHGVNIEPGGQVTTTDGQRLHTYATGLTFPVAETGAIVPACEVALAAIERASEVSFGLVEHCGAKYAAFIAPTRRFWSRLIDGQFPDYNQVMPALGGKQAECDAADLLAAIAAVWPVTSERTHGAKLTFDAGVLTLYVKTPDAGEATATVPLAFYDGWPTFSVGMNIRYLREAVTAADSRTVRLTFALATDPELSPVRVTGDRTAFDSIVMPMRL